MGTSSTNSTSYFTGSSAYSTDFNNVISRAVAIAELPITQLSNNKTTLSSQSTALTKLDTKFTALQTAISKLNSATGGASYQSEQSTPAVASVTLADGAQEGYYSLNVTSIGAYESCMSAANWNVPLDNGKPSTFQLVVGNRNLTITPSANTAQAVVDAINSNYGDLVQATTVNVASGDTRISLRSVGLGATTLDLLKVPSDATATSLQTAASPGYAVSQSTAAWDDSGSPATFTLTAGGDQYSISPASNSAADVAAAINTNYGDKVRATVVDLGSDSTHDYRINLQALAAGTLNGSTTLDLAREGGSSLQTQQIASVSRTTTPWDASADASGTRTNYTLVVGSNQYTLNATDNSAASVVSAINSQYGGQVHAMVLNLGTDDSPDYRISIQAPTGTAVDLKKTAVTSYQKEQTAGSLATYEVNNSGVTNTSSKRDIQISTGVTATLTGTGSTGITVTRSSSALSTALSGLADAYNAAVDELAGQRGQSAGALSGQPIVNQLSRLLSSISTYSSDGQINGLSAIGLDLGTDGHLTFNQFTMMAADLASSSAVTSFLGTASTGGFLKSATDILASVENAGTGILKTTESSTTAAITSLTSQIAAKQAVVDQMEINMQNQMAQADALIASLEQQYSYLTNLFTAQDTASKSYN
jgi:flagellar hook-associated protein 2